MSERWDAPGGLAGYHWRADGARGTVLLQHGYGEYAERYVNRYARLVPRLVEDGFDVHAFDAPGHGRSPGPRGLPDVRALVAAHLAARRLLDRPLFLLGHSLGGLVTAASVAREPANVAGVVLTGPALLIEAPAWQRVAVRLLSRVAPRLPVRPALDPAGISRVPVEVQAYFADPRAYHGKLPALVGATAFDVAAEGWPLYPRWSAPTLVVHGAADAFTDPEGSRRFHDAIASTDKRLVLIPEGRHESLNDLGADDTLALILSWLSDRA